MSYRTCRYCGQQDDSDQLVKYGTRHYAHATCLVDHAGKAALTKLPSVVVRALPVLPMRERGIDVFKLLAAAERRESPRLATGVDDYRHGYVYDERNLRIVESCTHVHRSERAAAACAESMLRRIEQVE